MSSTVMVLVVFGLFVIGIAIGVTLGIAMERPQREARQAEVEVLRETVELLLPYAKRAAVCHAPRGLPGIRYRK